MELRIKAVKIIEIGETRSKTKYVVIVETSKRKIRLARNCYESLEIISKHTKINMTQVQRILDKYDYFVYGRKIPTQKLIKEINSIGVMNNLTEVR